MRCELIFSMIFILLLGGFVLVGSQEGEEGILNYSVLWGIEGNVTGSGMKIVGTQEYNKKINGENVAQKEVIINFEEGGSLNSGKLAIKDVVPASDEVNATVILNKNGELIEADYTLSKKGDVTIGEKTIYDVPANSRVTFNEKDGLVIEVPNDSEYEGELFDCEVKGKNILLNGKTISGKLNYDSLGQAHVKKGNEAIIDNVKIVANEDLTIYSDGQKHSGNYLSFGDEFYFGGGGNPGEIVFEKGNEYFSNMAEGTSVKFGLGEDYSYVNVAPNSLKGYPDVNCYNQYSIETGKLLLESDGEKIIRKDGEWGDGSVKMDVFTSVGQFDKRISIGEDSNYYSYITEGEIDKSILAWNRKALNEGLDIQANSYEPSFVKKYLGPLSNYLRGGQALASKCIYAKSENCSKIKDIEFKTQGEVDQFAQSSAASGCYLTSKELNDCLENSIYKDYRKAEQYYDILEGVTRSTEGTTEEEYLFGIRKANEIFIGGIGSTEYINLTAINFTYNPDAY